MIKKFFSIAYKTVDKIATFNNVTKCILLNLYKLETNSQYGGWMYNYFIFLNKNSVGM